MLSRAQLFRVHNFAGIALAALMLVIGSSGVALIFRADLRAPTPVADDATARLSLDELVRRGVAEGDGSPATDITLPLEPGDPFIVYLDDDPGTEVYLDGSGRVLGVRESEGQLTRVLFLLHTGELIGLPGRGLALLSGVGLCVLALSGTLMWWSRRQARRRAG